MPLNRQQRRQREVAERKALRRIQAAAQRDKPREFRITATGGPVTIQAADPAGGDGKKLARFEGNAYTGAPMKPQGWWTPVVIDLDGVKIPSQNRPALRQHDHEQIVGHTDSVKVTKAGIEIAGVFSGEQQHADKVTVPAGNGFPWQLSVGANPTRTEFLEAGEETEVNGRKVSGPLTISRETEIGEISFVPLGADGDTSATVTASQGTPAMTAPAIKAALKELMADLKAAGKTCSYTDAEIDEMDSTTAKAALKKAMKAKAADDDDDDDDDKTEAERQAAIRAMYKAESDAALKAEREARAAERQRESAILAAVKKHSVSGEVEITVDGKAQKVPDLAAHAITAGWSADTAELHAMRLARPNAGVGVPGGLGYSTSQPILNEAVLEAAVFDALRGQFRLFDSDFYALGDDGKRRVPVREEKRITAEMNTRYPDQVRQAAHTHFKGRIGLQQLLTMLASANGYRGPATFNDPSGWSDVAGYLAAPAIRADGASSVNTPATLANVQNKFMLQGYMFTEQVFLEIGQVLPVKDLKATKSVQLFGDFVFQQLNPAGEIQHATVGDNPYANQAKLYARMITLEMQYLINDDLGMFGQVPMMLGRGWGLKVNDLFWTAFMNPGFDDGGSTNFYAATHTINGQSGNSNLSSGAGSTLSHAGLTAAKLLFDNQVDPAGKPLGVDAELLVYPPDLDVAAVELMNAQFLIMAGLASTAAATKQANTNIWKGRFNPLMSRYLNKSAYTGNSTTAWYLLANPALVPVIQIAALNGSMTPQVQTASQDWQFNTLGISTRGWGGVGVSAQNFRGAVKSNGS
jgi:hypothetical protein